MTVGRDVAGTEEGSGKTGVRERGGMALGSEVVAIGRDMVWHLERMWMTLGWALEKGCG